MEKWIKLIINIAISALIIWVIYDVVIKKKESKNDISKEIEIDNIDESSLLKDSLK